MPSSARPKGGEREVSQRERQVMERKVEELQHRQARWMQERELYLERGQVEDELAREYNFSIPVAHAKEAPAAAVSGTTCSTSAPTQQPSRRSAGPLAETHYFKPEDVVSRLTERITDRLRDELRTELQACSDSISNFVSGRLSLFHGLPGLRRQLGVAGRDVQGCGCTAGREREARRIPGVGDRESHLPHLLRADGHSFCQKCISSHTGTHNKTSCPFCRQAIASQAPNMALQQLILNFVSKRDKIRTGIPAFDSPAAAASSTLMPGADCAGSGTVLDDDDNSGRWEREHRMLDMRCRVLHNELSDTLEQKGKGRESIASARVVLQMFREEESKARAKLEAAERQMALVKAKVDEQEDRLEQLHNEDGSMDAKIDLIQRTLQPLEEEKDKLQLLQSSSLQG